MLPKRMRAPRQEYILAQMCKDAEPSESFSLFATARQLFSFGLVGTVGFLVDTLVLYCAVYCGSGLHFGRLASFMCAVTTTWKLNSRFTFARTRSKRALSEWGRFVISQLGGASVNLGVYFTLIQTSPLVVAHPILGVASGSISGMCVNYTVARLFVFRATSDPQIGRL
jgi:putative flippase GtrA